MKDALVDSLKDSSVIRDSELIAGFFSPIGFAAVILLVILLNHALFTEVVFSIHRGFMDPLLQQQRDFHARLVGYACALILVVGHLVDIVIWATSLVVTGLITSMSTALYYCGSTYTTLGFGVDEMRNGRSAITVIIALSGMLSVAITTSILMWQLSRYHEESRSRRIASRK